MKKRILIFSTAYDPFIGGAEVAIKEITNRLDQYEFLMLTAKMKKSLPEVEKIGNITVHRMGFGIPMVDKLLFALFGHRVALALHKKQPVDGIWSMMASYGGFAARLFKKKTAVPYLLTLQEGDPIEFILHRTRFVKTWFKEIFTRADALQAISTYLLNWGNQMGFAGKTKKVVPNGVDIARFVFDQDPQERAAIRNTFGFQEPATVLVTASRLVVKNGVEHVIRALPLLPEDVCFAICGSGALQESLETLTKELGLEKRVVFLGNKSHDELPKILHASDIFIRPSITEGLGNAFLEAMACKLPTIGTLVGGIPDFLVEGKTGFVCEGENPQSIADAVTRIQALSSKEKDTIQKQALDMVKDRFNWVSIATDMDEIFTSLLKK